MQQHAFANTSGVSGSIFEQEIPLDGALDNIHEHIDTAKGAIFSSGFDYPGRHSRWDIGFINPAVELVTCGRDFVFQALSQQGCGIVAMLPDILLNGHGLDNHPYLTALELISDNGNPSASSSQKSSQESSLQSSGPCSLPYYLKGTVKSVDTFITEEERPRAPSIFLVIRRFLEAFRMPLAPTQPLGLFGAFGYDLIFQFEDIELRHPRPTVLTPSDSSAIYDNGDAEGGETKFAEATSADRALVFEDKECHLFFPLELIAIDRKQEKAIKYNLVYNTPLGSTDTLSSDSPTYPLPARQPQPRGDSSIVCDHEPGEFADKVRKVIEGTKRGDYFEVVLSQSFTTAFNSTPFKLFQRLGEINPSPYMFLINLGNEQLVGTSPEIYARISGKRFETCPIAGTIPRGKDALEDADNVKTLLNSSKDESELTMCTDVDRNDMARVCLPGSVTIIGRRQLEFYSHLIHTVDHVVGELTPEFDALDAFLTHMWACTVTGAPKPSAVQEIENLEKSPRGWYSAAVGLLLLNGDLNTGITLRTAYLKQGRLSLRSGATLLYASDPDLEETETRTKAQAMLSALISLDAESPSTAEHDSSAVTTGISTTELYSNSAVLSTTPPKVLLVDCRDSFVHNLGAYLRELGAEVITVRAGFPISVVDSVSPDLVILSPGPGSPQEFQLSALMAQLIERKLPIFGVCLGHQAIGEYFGGHLAKLSIPYHGKPSFISHSGTHLFEGLPSPLEVGRYHSLHILKDSVPSCLEVIATTAAEESGGGLSSPTDVVMAIRHKELPIMGVQFHPESLMTLGGRTGHRMLKNILQLAKARQGQ